MELNQRIKSLRVAKNMTQESLAAALGITAQAVSKWENEQTCPDVALLPEIADLFGIPIDALFGRSSASPLPWRDDAYHIVVYKGQTLLTDQQVRELSDPQEMVSVYLVGDPQDVYCALRVRCGDVAGDVNAQEVRCGDVAGDVSAQKVSCGDIGGDVSATSVTANDIAGGIDAQSVCCEEDIDDDDLD